MRLRRAKWGWLACAAFAVASAPSVSGAANAPAPTGDAAVEAAKRETASQLVSRGDTLYREHRYDEACDAFAQAFLFEPRPGTVLNQALAELKGGHPVEAAAHFRQYLASEGEPEDKRAFVRTKFLPEAEAATARLEVFAPRGADIRIDGTLQNPPGPSDRPPGQSTPLSVLIGAGSHNVTARQGSFVESKTVIAVGGQPLEVHFQRLPDAVGSPAPALAWDSSGSHRERTDAPAAGPQAAKWITAVALGSAAVLATGVGIGLAVEARTLVNRTQSERAALDPSGTGGACAGAASSSEPCQTLASDVRSANRDSGFSMASYVTAGVLAAASVGAWALWPSDKSQKRALSVGPTVSARGGGVAVAGAW